MENKTHITCVKTVQQNHKGRAWRQEAIQAPGTEGLECECWQRIVLCKGKVVPVLN